MVRPPVSPTPAPRRLRRAAGAALGVLVCAAVLGWWASAHPGGWPQTLLARLPALSHFTAWLRHPDLSTLPGLPRHWNPWAPLTLQEPDGPFTRWKLGRLEASPTACLRWLADAPDIASTPLPDRMAGSAESAGQCSWKAVSRISGVGQVRFSSPFLLTCGAAVALARWEHQVLQHAARAQLGAPVVRIEHLGSYACRRIAGSQRLSEHASANALDVSAFILRDGRRISVLGDWQANADPATPVLNPASDGEKLLASAMPERPAPATHPKAAFLRQAHGGACQGFAAVLGPGYNAAHRDHFHLDRGPYRICR